MNYDYTGQNEVERAKTMFEEQIDNDTSCAVLTAYGKQSAEDQSKLFEKMSVRKIIFATDVAETSVTIDGVRHVIDTGMKKDVIYDGRRNVTSLQVMKISRSSAIQRTGRAGRTSRGVCYRLYTEEDFELMLEGDVPELKRVPLANMILNLIKMNLDARYFDWLDKPDPAALESAIEDLVFCEAIETIENGRRHTITSVGELIVETQLPPGLVKMIVEGSKLGFADAAVRLASICQMSDSFFWRVSAKDKDKRTEAEEIRLNIASTQAYGGDLSTMFRLYTKFEDILKSRQVPSEWAKIEIEKCALDLNDFNLSRMEKTQSLNFAIEEEEDDRSIFSYNETDRSSQVSESTSITSAEVASMNDFVDEFDDQLDLVDVESEEAQELADAFEEEREQKACDEFLRKNKKSIAAWMRQNYLSQKTLMMIRSNVRKYSRNFQKTQFCSRGKSGSASGEQQPDDTQLAFIIFSGLFVNFTAKTRKREYLALRSQLAGRFYPGSCLAMLNSFPDYICYQSVLRLNSSVYFLCPFKVERDWLKQVSPVFERSLKQMPQKLGPFGPFDLVFIQEFGGKNGYILPQLESRFNCSIDLDLEEKTITAWPKCEDTRTLLEHEIRQSMLQIQREAENKIDEVKVTNSMSVLVGKGGHVLNIIFAGQYCSVVLRGLATLDTVNKLRNEIASGNNNNSLRSFKVLRDHSSSSDDFFTVYAMFSDFEHAKRVKDKYDNEIIDSRRIRCNEVGLLKSKSFKDVTSCLRMSYALGKSTGSGSIFFDDPARAQQAVELLRASFPTLNATLIPPKTSKNKLILVSVKDPTKLVTENQIKTVLKNFGLSPLSVVIKRNASDFDLETSRLDKYRNDWIRRVPIFSHNTIMTEFRDEKRSLIGMLVTFESPEQARVCYEAMPAHLAQLSVVSPLPESFQYEVEYTGTYSLHKKLYQTFQNAIDVTLKHFDRDPDVISINRKEGTDGKNQVFYIKTNRLEKVRQVQTQLEKTIEVDLFSLDKQKLLSLYGRNEMSKISDEVAYLHWEMRSGNIWIYGNAQQRLKGREALENLVSRLRDIKHVKIKLNRQGIR